MCPEPIPPRRLATSICAAAVAVVGAALAGLGYVIAPPRRVPAPPRRYDLAIRGALRHGEHDAVVMDRGPGSSAAGVYNVWLEDGGWAQVGAVVDEGPDTVTRIVLATKPVGALREGQRASWSAVYYESPGDA